MNARRAIAWVFWMLAVVPASVRGDVRPHPLFSDGCVLQAEKPIAIWGSGTAGETVTISVAVRGTEIKAQCVCQDGQWRVNLPPMKAGGPLSMTITGSSAPIRLEVYIGEVWLCSGQSNMDQTVRQCDRGEEEIANSANANIRLCKIPRRAADEPQEIAPLSWQACSPQSVRDFSGVAYFFGRDLQQHLGVPVGLIDAAYGGTPAEAWMSPAAVRSRPEFQPILDEYAQQVKDSPRAMAKYQADLEQWPKEVAAAKAANRPIPPGPSVPMGPFNFRRPNGLYYGMIHPLAPFQLRGFLWYQGERNSPRALQYRTLLPALIADWRNEWQQPDLPFLFVQLAPFGSARAQLRDSYWAELREAQLLTSKAVANTAMAVITDSGDEADIHPKRKQPVGARLALAARAKAYGESIEYSGPVYRNFSIHGERIAIEFDHIGAGLVCRGDKLEGFSICGADRKFVAAEAVVVDDRVEVFSPAVKSPVAVRFGWADYPVVNLWNKDGLPASPFRTDDFPGISK